MFGICGFRPIQSLSTTKPLGVLWTGIGGDANGLVLYYVLSSIHKVDSYAQCQAFPYCLDVNDANTSWASSQDQNSTPYCGSIRQLPLELMSALYAQAHGQHYRRELAERRPIRNKIRAITSVHLASGFISHFSDSICYRKCDTKECENNVHVAGLSIMSEFPFHQGRAVSRGR